MRSLHSVSSPPLRTVSPPLPPFQPCLNHYDDQTNRYNIGTSKFVSVGKDKKSIILVDKPTASTKWLWDDDSQRSRIVHVETELALGADGGNLTLVDGDEGVQWTFKVADGTLIGKIAAGEDGASKPSMLTISDGALGIKDVASTPQTSDQWSFHKVSLIVVDFRRKKRGILEWSCVMTFMTRDHHSTTPSREIARTARLRSGPSRTHRGLEGTNVAVFWAHFPLFLPASLLHHLSISHCPSSHFLLRLALPASGLLPRSPRLPQSRLKRSSTGRGGDSSKSSAHTSSTSFTSEAG